MFDFNHICYKYKTLDIIQFLDPLLSSIELTSEAKFNDLPLTQPCLYFKRENSKVKSLF